MKFTNFNPLNRIFLEPNTYEIFHLPKVFFFFISQILVILFQYQQFPCYSHILNKYGMNDIRISRCTLYIWTMKFFPCNITLIFRKKFFQNFLNEFAWRNSSKWTQLLSAAPSDMVTSERFRFYQIRISAIFFLLQCFFFHNFETFKVQTKF